MPDKIELNSTENQWTQQPLITDYTETQFMQQLHNIIGVGYHPVEYGVGDDGAVVVMPSGHHARIVLSTDMLVEDRHFHRRWISPFDLGRRAIIHSAADCAAMAADPLAYTLALSVPATLSAKAVSDILRGAHYQAQLWSGQLVGGDFVIGTTIVISVTVCGTAFSPIPYMSGARSHDVIAISGPIGMAAAGLTCFLSEFPLHTATYDQQEEISWCKKKFLVPHGPVDQDGNFLSRYHRQAAHALTDVSDGLIRELQTIAHQSHVSLTIDATQIPTSPACYTVAQLMDCSHDNSVDLLYDFLLTGGEDHVLLGSFAPQSLPQYWWPIGTVHAGDPKVEIIGAPQHHYQGWDTIQS